MAAQALKYDVEVMKNGQVVCNVPFPTGAHVTVFVIGEEKHSQCRDSILEAAQSSLDFWDNPLDDEDWNDV